MTRDELFQMETGFKNACVMKAGKLLYCTKNEKHERVLTVRDIETDNKTEIVLPEDIGFINHAPVLYEELGMVFIQGDIGCLLDVEGGNSCKIASPDGWEGAQYFSGNCSDGRFAVSDGKTILFAGKDGAVTNTIGCPGAKLIGMTIRNNELLVLYNDGSLYCYATDTGQFVRKTEAFMNYGFDGEAAFDFDEENHLLYIQMDRLTDVFDLESGVQIAHINTCFGHHKGRDIFVTSAEESNDKKQVGYYKRYSVEELIEKAHEILRNAELTNETKSRYGIAQETK